MKISEEKLKKALLEKKLVAADKLEDIWKQSVEEGTSFIELLVSENVVSDENIGRLLAETENLDFIVLKGLNIEDDVLRLIPEVIAKQKMVVAFKRDNDGVRVAMVNPRDQEAIGIIEKKIRDIVMPYYATKRDVEEALTLYTEGVESDFESLVKKYSNESEESSRPEDAPIVNLVEALVSYAQQNHASDIHLEPQKERLLVRFRIDGILHEIARFTKKQEELLTSRIKILSRLRIDEHRAAQDGKFRFDIGGQSIDVRVSVIPITEGEKVVMRLLSEENRRLGLEDLGFSKVDMKSVRSAFEKPFGMILSTGPTGSGKTTSLYAILNILNTKSVNISTIEDPVEYNLPGVNQIQVNPKANLTFASGLRSILRQDPDIIMVGEIRDEETASIAINSAMTGHLVLSTLHTNDAATALPRLLDMKIEPFLIASTVNLIIAQRLVRMICSHCRVSKKISRQDLSQDLSEKLISKHFGQSRERILVFRGKGCKICGDTGYAGRIGIFEVLLVSESIKKLIMQRDDASVIKNRAIEEGMTTMLDDGIRKVIEGQTTLEEVLRVTK